MNKSILLLILCFFTFPMYAQNTFSGKVSDKYGKGINDVKIFIGDKTITTDSKGVFQVNLTSGVHHIKVKEFGYAPIDTLCSIPNKEFFLIQLQESYNEIDEVVVNTGYERVSKTRSTGSFSFLSKKELDLQVTSDVISKIEGMIGGYNIDRKSNGSGGYGIMIRGLSTIRGPRSPLIILDNFPYEGDISNLNPNEVENITVLKDAAAASIWGAKAGNGVIVITTKKANYNQSLKVNLSANTKFIDATDLFYKKRISTSDFIDVENMLFNKGYYNAMEKDLSKPPLSEVVEIRIAERDGVISKLDAESRINNLRNYDLRNEIKNRVFRTGINQQYAIDVSAGGNKNNWMFFGGFDNNINELQSQNSRYNLGYNQSLKISANLLLSAKINYTNTNATNGIPNIMEVNVSPGILPLYTRLIDNNGKELPVLRNYRQEYLKSAGNGKLLDWGYYPLSEKENIDFLNKMDEFTTNLNLSLKLNSFLSVSTAYRFTKQVGNVKTNYSENSFFTRDLINRFTQIDGNGLVKRIIPLGEIRDLSLTDGLSHNLRLQLGADKNLGKHTLTGIAGAEVKNLTIESSSMRYYGVNPESLTISNVDLVNSYKTFINGSNAIIPSNNSFGGTTNKSISLYFNGAYSFDNKYTVSMSARRDAANTYGLNINDKWNPLFSTGIAWVLSNEDFYKSKLLPYIRVRATYGSSGNTDQNMAAVTTIVYSSVASPYTQSPTASFFNYENPQLRWEKVYMFNAGVDLGFFNNRLKGSIEFYQKKSVDLFSLAQIDYTSGIGSTIVKNAGIISSKGIDIELNSSNLTGNFIWNTFVNLSFYKDKVEKYYLANRIGKNFLNGNTSITAIEGFPVYGLYSYKWAGLSSDSGDPQGYKDGKVSKDYAALTGNDVLIEDLKFHGSAIPKLSGSIGNNFSFKGFNLDFRINYKFGYFFRKSSLSYTSLYASRDGNGEFENRWQKAGDEKTTNVPSLVYPAVSSRDSFYAGSEVNVLKGDHFRLQYVNLSYKLRNINYIKFLKNTNVFVVASNLGVIWSANKYGIDPDYKETPASKSIAIGLNSKF